MTDKYCATMENNVHIGRQDYWKVNIEANSLNELNNICSALNLIKNGGLNDSTNSGNDGKKEE